MEYRNPGSVVVVMAPYFNGLIMIRRNLEVGKGQLALPGGYQGETEDWRDAGIREFKEETGINLNPMFLEPLEFHTSKEAKANILFGIYNQHIPLVDLTKLKFDEVEVQEVVVIHEPIETAFPLHTAMVRRFFTEL